MYIRLKAPYQRETLISTGKYINPTTFNNKIGFENTSTSSINSFIRREINVLDDIIYDQLKTGREFNCQIIKNKYLNKDSLHSFVSFAVQELERIKSTTNHKTWKDYMFGIRKLEDYSPKVTFQEMDSAFLEEYKTYQIKICDRSPNGVYHDLAAVRKIWNIALNRGLISEYPFKDFKMPKLKNKKVYLVKSELDKVWDLWQSKKLGESRQRGCFYFLLSCYTGFRWTDVKLFSADMLKNPGKLKSILVNQSINLKMSKSGFSKEVTIPLHTKLRILLENFESRPLKQSNSRINDDLKVIMQSLDIDKSITFHGARHTFGVVSKELGIDTATLRDLLGHSTITTTEIYEEIANHVLKREMSKWDNA